MRTRVSIPGRGERTADEGFTLIELLVVIIIIGILAAIAIPVYFAQRDRAYDSAAKSDLRNLAQFEETLLAGTNTYGSFTDLANDNMTVRPTRLVTLTIQLQRRRPATASRPSTPTDRPPGTTTVSAAESSPRAAPGARWPAGWNIDGGFKTG